MNEAPAEEVEVEASETPAAPVQMSVEEALQKVLKEALATDSVARGIRESVKTLDKKKAALCVLAENCDEATYKKLVEAICKEHSIPLIKIPDNIKLGEWLGLCKIDREGKARKVVRCSCCVIKDTVEESEAFNIVRNYLASQ